MSRKTNKHYDEESVIYVDNSDKKKRNRTGFDEDGGYERPQTTFQEQLSPQEIIDKLQGYDEVDDISQVEINTHVRYFTEIGDKVSFRLGGFLLRKENAHEYVMLTNNHTKPWSVQTKKTVFFRKLTEQEHIDRETSKYRQEIEIKDEMIKQMRKKIERLTGQKYDIKELYETLRPVKKESETSKRLIRLLKKIKFNRNEDPYDDQEPKRKPKNKIKDKYNDKLKRKKEPKVTVTNTDKYIEVNVED
jgi:hypothetical protein